MSNASNPYILIGVPIGSSSREGIYAELKRCVRKHTLCSEIALFSVPLNLKFGSFDDLIRTVDELPRHESAVEATLRRIQRQAVDINPNVELNISWHGKSLTIDQYITRFTWDDSKYPRIRHLRDNLDYLIQSVHKLDDNVKAKASSWVDAKSKSAEVSKKENLSFSQADLIDILTPAVVTDDDLIETEHLITVVVYVPRGQESEWKTTYETLDSYVVPRSAKKFNLVDKEGGSLWRVILFKSSYQGFTKAAKDHRFIVREFQYSSRQYEALLENRAKMESEKSRQEVFLSRMCVATFSDLFMALMHLKAMRMFCEAALRYGVPANFASFVLRPRNDSKLKRLRKELEIMFLSGGFSDLYSNSTQSNGGNALLGAEEDTTEYFPYVNITLSTFV